MRVSARLDDAAVTSAGATSTALATADLAKAGWAVSGIRRLPAGGGEVIAERAFASIGQANNALSQLSGPGGVLPDLRLSRSHGLFATTLRLRGTADLSKGLAGFGDERLKALFASTSPVGFDDAEVARQTGAPVSKIIGFRVTSELAGTRVSQTVPFGGSLRFNASKRSIVWLGPASLAALLIGLVGLGWLLRPRDHLARVGATGVSS